MNIKLVAAVKAPPTFFKDNFGDIATDVSKMAALSVAVDQFNNVLDTDDSASLFSHANMTAAMAASIADNDNITAAKAASIFDHANLTDAKGASIFDNANPTVSKLISILDNANISSAKIKSIFETGSLSVDAKRASTLEGNQYL